MSVYKKFSPLDYATVPFNAHKQYDFNSASAALNKITHFDTRWTSESISIYSGNSGSDDSINAIKYQQLDHLFYRNFKLDVNNRLGDSHYLKQRRVLYENANILSIPAGLYGHQIKPGSFFLSSSNRKFVDDNNGNLMISGTIISDYITDPRANVLNIGPVKGFKLYDLNTIDGYLDGFEGNNVFYKDGEPRVNPTYDSYSSKEFLPQGKYDHDDSYYFNNIEYKEVTFSERQLFDKDKFPGVDFNGSSSQIIIGHDDKFNYNKDDDFTIMFFTSGARNVPGVTNYIISKNTTKTIIPSPIGGKSEIYNTQTTGSSQPVDVFSEPQFPFEVYLEHVNASPHVFFRKSDGDITYTVSASFNTGSIDSYTQIDFNNQTSNTDYITGSSNNSANFNNLSHVFNGSTAAAIVEASYPLKQITIDVDMYGYLGESKTITKIDINFSDHLGFSAGHKQIEISGSNDAENWAGISKETFITEIPVVEREFSFFNATPYKWYRITFNKGLYELLGNNQFILKIEEIKFYEGSNFNPHITCRSSASKMQILVDGNLINETDPVNLKSQTQNTSNIYIGSKGGKTNFYTGSLSQINIFNRALTNKQVFNHYISNDGSPYVGNIFYSNGIIALTQPGVEEFVFAKNGIGEMILGETFIIDPESTEAKEFMGINKLQFQGSHLIYEHEYQCTLDEYEFTDTLNPSARKIRSHQSPDLADFATGSLFKPYITTVGLYNENNELLVVGKLGQPIRTSDETDTTLIVRWDT